MLAATFAIPRALVKTVVSVPEFVTDALAGAADRAASGVVAALGPVAEKEVAEAEQGAVATHVGLSTSKAKDDLVPVVTVEDTIGAEQRPVVAAVDAKDAQSAVNRATCRFRWSLLAAVLAEPRPGGRGSRQP